MGVSRKQHKGGCEAKFIGVIIQHIGEECVIFLHCIGYVRWNLYGGGGGGDTYT